jgi:nitrous oxide reductase accessory protein NosL
MITLITEGAGSMGIEAAKTFSMQGATIAIQAGTRGSLIKFQMKSKNWILGNQCNSRY